MQVNEIFTSLSGEPDGFGMQGGLATFVRLQGCNLECEWCDTKKAQKFDNWEDSTVAAVVQQCTCKHIIITGGEPLLQLEEVKQLVLQLTKARKFVTVETNGSIAIADIALRVNCNHLRFVVDYKLSSSGTTQYMLPEVFNGLHVLDVIKFVIADLQDYQQAKAVLAMHQHWRAKKVFSPTEVTLEWPKQLVAAILEDKLEGVTLSLQLHKLLHMA